MEPGVFTIPSGYTLPRMLGDHSQPSGRDILKDPGASGIRNKINLETPKGDFFAKEDRLLR